MITPTHCRKIVDDILFDSFGVYHYVFLEEPLILIGEYNFVFEAKFSREGTLRIYNFTAMRIDEDELLVMVTSTSSRLHLNVFFADDALHRMTTSKRYSPDFEKYATEHFAPREDTIISHVTFTIRDEIGDRHQI